MLIRTIRPLRLPLSLLLAAAGCSTDSGGVGPGDTFGPGGAPVVPTDAEVAAVASVLSLDLRALPRYTDPLPPYYRPVVLAREDGTPARNPTTDPGASLGRVLFFDPALSRTRTVSCASCHAPEHAFGDDAVRSVGADGMSRTELHAMRLTQVRFNPSQGYFRDRRAPSLEAQVAHPILDPVEMGFDPEHGGMAALVDRLSGLPYYPPLFRMAFGDGEVTATGVERALAQYLRSLVSTGSRWDRGFIQVFQPAAPTASLERPIPGFTAQEERGRRLFMGSPPAGAGCAACHVPPTFALAADAGGNGLDRGETRRLRSPSLRNVALGRRFMHDGRYGDLDRVVSFYDSGVQPGPALDARLLLPSGVPRRLGLLPGDREALVAFLGTLSDPEMLGAERFGNPFLDAAPVQSPRPLLEADPVRNPHPTPGG